MTAVPIPISPDAAARLESAAQREASTVDAVAERMLQTLPLRAGWSALTPTEARIATMIALGAKRLDIAATLGIDAKTIDTHRGHVLRKLGLRTSVALARYAIRIGVVGTEESEYEVGRLTSGGPRPGRAPTPPPAGRRDRPGALLRRTR